MDDIIFYDMVKYITVKNCVEQMCCINKMFYKKIWNVLKNRNVEMYINYILTQDYRSLTPEMEFGTRLSNYHLFDRLISENIYLYTTIHPHFKCSHFYEKNYDIEIVIGW